MPSESRGHDLCQERDYFAGPRIFLRGPRTQKHSFGVKLKEAWIGALASDELGRIKKSGLAAIDSELHELSFNLARSISRLRTPPSCFTHCPPLAKF
jgi:hypothetical protein